MFNKKHTFAVKLCLMIIAILFLIVLPILGVCAFQSGLPTVGFFCFLPLVYMIIYGIWTLIDRYKDRRWAAVCRMYDIPKRDVRPEDVGGELLHRGFRTVIDDAIKQTTDADKLSDLQDCRRTVLNILDDEYGDSDMDNIRRAFRYTGCHIRIEDRNGNMLAEF